MIGVSAEIIEHHVKTHIRSTGCDPVGDAIIQGTERGRVGYMLCPDCHEPLFQIVSPEHEERPVMQILQDLAEENGWETRSE